MYVLLDNDIVVIGARCDLLEPLASLHGGRKNLLVLDTLPYAILHRDPAKRLQRLGSDQAASRLSAFLPTIGRVPPARDRETVATLADAPQIDPGEVLLFASAAECPEQTVLTGDKKALRALANGSNLEQVRQRLRGRIKCLEQTIAELIENLGFDEVNRRIQGDLTPETADTADTVLKVCFSTGREASAIDGLAHYYAALAAEVGGLLAPPPNLIT